jgi:hypothetical protein
MHIEMQTEGGIAAFPGLSRPVAIDTAQLPPADASALEDLARKADFFALPAQASTAPAGAADYRRYTITIDDGGRSHTVVADEPIENPDLRALVERLQAQARAQRAAPRESEG